jgi:hypothetical protein
VTTFNGVDAHDFHTKPQYADYRVGFNMVCTDKPYNVLMDKEHDKVGEDEYAQYATYWWTCTATDAWVLVRCSYLQFHKWYEALHAAGFAVSSVPLLFIKAPKFCHYRGPNTNAAE